MSHVIRDLSLNNKDVVICQVLWLLTTFIIDRDKSVRQLPESGKQNQMMGGKGKINLQLLNWIIRILP